MDGIMKISTYILGEDKMRELLYQTKNTAQRPSAKAVFWLLMSAVLVNYIAKVTALWGADTVNLYEPMKLRLLADHSDAITLRIVQLYPLLVVIPTGFSYMADRDNRTDVYIRGRIGNKRYVRNEIISSFIVAFLVFAIPFLVEILLFCAGFPINQTGDPTNISDYDPVYQEVMREYLFSSLYEAHPYLYAVVNVLLWGVTAGALGCFSTCVSMLGIKLRAILFLPVYVLIYMVSALENLFLLPYTTNYIWYLLSYDSHRKWDMGVLFFDLAVLAVCVLIMAMMERRDWRK